MKQLRVLKLNRVEVEWGPAGRSRLTFVQQMMEQVEQVEQVEQHFEGGRLELPSTLSSLPRLRSLLSEQLELLQPLEQIEQVKQLQQLEQLEMRLGGDSQKFPVPLIFLPRLHSLLIEAPGIRTLPGNMAEALSHPLMKPILSKSPPLLIALTALIPRLLTYPFLLPPPPHPPLCTPSPPTVSANPVLNSRFSAPTSPQLQCFSNTDSRPYGTVSHIPPPCILLTITLLPSSPPPPPASHLCFLHPASSHRFAPLYSTVSLPHLSHNPLLLFLLSLPLPSRLPSPPPLLLLLHPHLPQCNTSARLTASCGLLRLPLDWRVDWPLRCQANSCAAPCTVDKFEVLLVLKGETDGSGDVAQWLQNSVAAAMNGSEGSGAVIKGRGSNGQGHPREGRESCSAQHTIACHDALEEVESGGCEASFQQGEARAGKKRQGEASRGKVRQGQARRGKARQGEARAGKKRQGEARAGKKRQGEARAGKKRQGEARAGKKRQGEARAGKKRQGEARAGKKRQGEARAGKKRQGEARAGKKRQGEARAGKKRQGEARAGKKRQGEARAGKKRQGEARAGKKRQGEARAGKKRQGEARAGKKRQGEARAGKKRQGEARAGKKRQGEARAGKKRQGEVRAGKKRQGEASDCSQHLTHRYSHAASTSPPLSPLPSPAFPSTPFASTPLPSTPLPSTTRHFIKDPFSPASSQVNLTSNLNLHLSERLTLATWSLSTIRQPHHQERPFTAPSPPSRPPRVLPAPATAAANAVWAANASRPPLPRQQPLPAWFKRGEKFGPGTSAGVEGAVRSWWGDRGRVGGGG
ncbi:unnamed protein product [Closterium sp. NIES-64]|nr:unnamed protein product [Closterium sp. NIES-64]